MTQAPLPPEDASSGKPATTASATTPAQQPRRGLARVKTFDSLRHRDYRLLWVGNLLANYAYWLQVLTVGWLMYQLTKACEECPGDPVLTGTVVGIRTLPVLIIGPWAGVLADRVDRRKLIQATQFALAAAAVVFAVLVAISDVYAYPHTGPLEIWHLFAYVTIAGIAHAIVQPVRQALIPNVIPRSSLGNAMALNAMTRTSTRLLAPAIGGILIQLIGFKWNFFFEAGCYIGMALLLFPMKMPYRTESDARQHSMWRNMVEGLSYIGKTREILGLILLSFIPNFVFQPVVFILPVFVAGVLGGREGLGGLLLSAMGVGGVAATFVIASIGFRFRKGLTVLLALVIGSASVIVMAVAHNAAVAALMFLILGFCQTNFRVGNMTLLHSIVPDNLRGRVTSIYEFDNGFTPLATLLTSLLISVTDPVTGLTITGAVGLAAALGFLFFNRAVRRLE